MRCLAQLLQHSPSMYWEFAWHSPATAHWAQCSLLSLQLPLRNTPAPAQSTQNTRMHWGTRSAKRPWPCFRRRRLRYLLSASSSMLSISKRRAIRPKSANKMPILTSKTKKLPRQTPRGKCALCAPPGPAAAPTAHVLAPRGPVHRCDLLPAHACRAMAWTPRHRAPREECAMAIPTAASAGPMIPAFCLLYTGP